MNVPYCLKYTGVNMVTHLPTAAYVPCISPDRYEHLFNECNIKTDS